MTLELTDKEIEARVRDARFNTGLELLKLTCLIKVFRKKPSDELATKIYKFVTPKKWEYTIAEYIYRNTKIMVEIK
jgi:hypothetical protein